MSIYICLRVGLFVCVCVCVCKYQGAASHKLAYQSAGGIETSLEAGVYVYVHMPACRSVCVYVCIKYLLDISWHISVLGGQTQALEQVLKQLHTYMHT